MAETLARGAFALALLIAGGAAASQEEEPLHAALERLTREGRFSGAVVIRHSDGVRFARGYGLADPFSERRFTPDTPVDSASLAKPVTAAAVLLLAQEGRIDLDSPVRRYLPGYPHEATTVRHLLAHSAGLPPEQAIEPLDDKTNEMLMNEVAERRLAPRFAPGTGFDYCNLCYSTLASLIERVSGDSYLAFVQRHVALPTGVTIRPLRLADWSGRAIGYRRTSEGRIERADSYESEAFYGSGNFSISASQLAQWGTEWWKPQLAPSRPLAVTPARINESASGLSWGNWYCSPRGEQCHYLGHHEGFHHMLYWDAQRRRTVGMVSNNALAPALQQRVQRAIVAFAEERPETGVAELASELPDNPVQPGKYVLSTGENVIVTSDQDGVTVERRGIHYRAYLIAVGIRYVPGLDTYLAGAANGRLHWLNLYEDMLGNQK